ncbi:nuclear transport factor 2 family protein [Rhabdothermincola salaria]|uniref:nuclear transport factor 2 family protein n=1 Tax=Rhabdothermincola salaria TaxID=2903142 RepID=UPI001E5D6FF6|nr:nuclear transport factor 2 family protein [Rhabdothermincola salaria]MCD9624016.1 nuclear transport factor 2 family protein [Rhabdothermincola salaria]
MSDLEARLARLEATEEIRQLAARYALALDQRDVQALAALFVDDVRTGDGRVGREALADWFDPILRPYSTTFHLIGNHVIDLVDEDHATGVVYCRPEHEVGDLWVVMPMQYWDRYERRDGHWYFVSRSPKVFYAADVLEHPLRVPERFHFPGNPMITRAELPGRWETWQAFWDPKP